MRLKPVILWYLTLFVLAITAWFTVLHRVDPDLWWRMRHGQDIIAQGLSTKESYSYTMPSFPFVSHAWSFDILVGWLVRFGGYPTLVTLSTVITTLTFAAITFPNRRRWLGTFQVLILWAGCISFFGVRAQVIAWPFLAFTIWLCLLPLERWQKWRWSIPILALLWANLHGSFPILPLLLGARFLATWVGEKHFDLTDLLLSACPIPLSLLNPYGIGLWQEIWLTNTDPTLRNTISEWLPLWRKTSEELLFFAMLLGAAGTLAVVQRAWRCLALLLVTATLSLLSARHLPLFTFTAIATLALLISRYDLAKAYQALRKDLTLRRVTAGIGALITLFLLWIPINALAFSPPITNPVDATTYLRSHYPQAVVFSHYNWGGYLIWARPEGKVFIDGRMPSWRWEAPANELDWAHHDWEAIAKGDKKLFDQDTALFHIDTVLWPVPWGSPSPLLNLLHDEGWQSVYADETTVIYRAPNASP